MPFYIRKSVSVGPFRFNLSKSGLGVSAGVKGLRVGTGPRGSYVHMGAGGLYYRTSLGKGQKQPYQASVPTVPVPPARQSSDPGIYHTEQIETGDLMQMSPGNVGDIVQQINEKAEMMSRWPWVLILGIAATIFIAFQSSSEGASGNQIPGYWVFIAAAMTALATYVVKKRDAVRKAVVILYDLEDDAQEKYKNFVEEFDRVAAASKAWNIDTSAKTSNWKRNAGATNLIGMAPALFGYRAPLVVKTNVDVPSIIGGSSALFFFPDVMLVQRGKSHAAVPYGDVSLKWGLVRFVEEGTVPHDAVIIGRTWKYPNKNGGPDRRFKNNHEIPEVQYQAMTVTAPGNFRKVLYLSKTDDRGKFDEAMAALHTEEEPETLRLVDKYARK